MSYPEPDYQDIIKAVTKENRENRWRDDTHSGTLVALRNYTVRLPSVCPCKEVYDGLITSLAYSDANPSKVCYFSPKEIEFYGKKVAKGGYYLDIPSVFSCTGKCVPSEHKAAYEEVKKIIAAHYAGIPYRSDVLTPKGY